MPPPLPENEAIWRLHGEYRRPRDDLARGPHGQKPTGRCGPALSE
jgi:hypothetical protein